jgi:hypothetical protein
MLTLALENQPVIGRADPLFACQAGANRLFVRALVGSAAARDYPS